MNMHLINRPFFLTVLAALALLSCGVVNAEESKGEIWAALVVGTLGDTPAITSEELKPFEKGLKKVFGYDHFTVKGSATRAANELWEQWLIPSEEFYLKVIATKVTSAGYEVYLELYQGEEFLVKLDAKVAKGKPLFIRGPEWGMGQLVIVLLAR